MIKKLLAHDSHRRNPSEAGKHQIERRGIPVGSEHSNAKDGNQYVCVHGRRIQERRYRLTNEIAMEDLGIKTTEIKTAPGVTLDEGEKVLACSVLDVRLIRVPHDSLEPTDIQH